MLDGTRKFSMKEESNKEMKRVLQTVYDALKENGYNPINQIVGYLLSEDPTYIMSIPVVSSTLSPLKPGSVLQNISAGLLSVLRFLFSPRRFVRNLI